jgi:hypothetical protein
MSTFSSVFRGCPAPVLSPGTSSPLGRTRGVTTSEDWFDEDLDANGYSYEEEPDLGVVKRPDRLIERVGVEAICEVKEFTTDAMKRRWPEGGSVRLVQRPGLDAERAASDQRRG